LREQLDFDFEMVSPTTMAAPLAQDHNRELAQSLVRAAQCVFPASEVVGLPFTTHAPRYAQIGIPTVVFGPGAIEQAHTADEWLAVEQLDRATDILFEFLASFSR
jgi:acetylornithine deacetylase